ncbi:MAG TPA: competence/damage-inducible protein A [Polyangiaceae bacterium]|jgi:nicotinamide-nucleotide amidase|nr:competence/damage-inducible protein A [Polyangiaceae bacterium]
MTVAILSIGSELLRGEIADTNAQFIAEQVTELGFEVTNIEVVPDNRDALVSELRRMLDAHPLVIATGGLGPTTDDLTAQAAADYLGVDLSTHEDALAAIKRRVEDRGGELRAGHEKQARLPAGAEMLPNSIGTAPGFIVRLDRATAYFLPGVPEEMSEMLQREVLPRIRGSATHNGFDVCLHVFGVGESWIAERLDGLEAAHPGVTVSYRAKHSDIDVRLKARGADYADARDRVKAAADDARQRLGDVVYGEGDQSMPMLAGRTVRTRGWTLAVAESCTGGLIAQQLTAIPASDYFIGGAVAYANTAKTNLLGVSEDTLRGHGAVSAEVAAEMAEGARRAFNCDVAVSVTGIAGPTGGTSDKPVGLCYWAVAHPNGTKVEHRVFNGNRNQIQQQAAFAALDLLRRAFNGSPR